ncbi:MAG TPA: hypothetical protein VF609_03520 [Flavisolibacter sp.]|jgi:hypothetical protein
MKHIKRLIFLFAFAFAVTTGNAQIKSADSIINKLFTSLRNKDEKAFITLYPNGQQMASLMRGMMETMFKSEEMQKMMAMDEKSKNMNIDSLINAQISQVTKPEAQAEMQKSFGKSFQDIIEKGEKKGVNWSGAQLVSYTLDSSAQAGDDQEAKMFAGAGIKNLKGVIDFKASGTDYQMNFDKVLYIPSEGGWFGGEFKQVIKKGESFALEQSADAAATDSATTAPESKMKTKAKTNGSKIKTKTKTPITKAKTKTKA